MRADRRPLGELPDASEATRGELLSQSRNPSEKTPEIRAVLFDLDGTLLDTARDFWECLNQLRAEENLEPLAFEAVRCQVSHGGHALVRLGFGELPPDAHEALRMRLLNIYRQRLARHTRLFEGGEEMLGEIERRGIHWGVVTNKPGWLTDPLMVEVNLHQ